jgi:hypothetical protein
MDNPILSIFGFILSLASKMSEIVDSVKDSAKLLGNFVQGVVASAGIQIEGCASSSVFDCLITHT